MTAPAQEACRDNVDYRRVKIRGTLCCESDLHLGDGATAGWRERTDLPPGREPPELNVVDEKGNRKPLEYHTACLAAGRPYLPGSSLRGSLHGQLPEGDLRERLFGLVRKPEEGASRAGRVRIHDAFLTQDPTFADRVEPPYWSAARHTAARHAIAIDPLTGTAEHKKLFSHEIVPAGSAFAVEIEVDDITRDELACLLGLLQRWEGGLWSALGGKRGKGWGRVRWELAESGAVRVLNPDGLQRWLSTDDAPLDDFFKDGAELVPILSAAIEQPVSLSFRLLADGPILVNEPGYRRTGGEGEEHPPTHEYSRRPGGRSIIPGKSLIGVVRGRARRILATIAHQHCGADPTRALFVAKELTRELFGHTGRRGALWIGDAEADQSPEDQPIPHPQFFNAIDRFTGGVKGPKGAGALFSVNACADGSYSGQLLLETGRLANKGDRADWWKGLLLLVARDAIEGDLAVGWGKAKGYGAFRAVLGEDTGLQIGTWPQLVEWARSRDDPAAWIASLHGEVEARLPAAPAPESDDAEGRP